MIIIKNFDSEAIATFELSVFGQEILLFENDVVFVFLPFYKLGYYDDIKGLIHNYNLGYIIFEDVENYKIKKSQYKNDGSQDFGSKVGYEVIFEKIENNSYNRFEIADIGLSPVGLVWQSLKVNCKLLHIAYDFISNDCSSTNYFEASKNKEVNNFLLTQDLSRLYKILTQIYKTG